MRFHLKTGQKALLFNDCLKSYSDPCFVKKKRFLGPYGSVQKSHKSV